MDQEVKAERVGESEGTAERTKGDLLLAVARRSSCSIPYEKSRALDYSAIQCRLKHLMRRTASGLY